MGGGGWIAERADDCLPHEEKGGLRRLVKEQLPYSLAAKKWVEVALVIVLWDRRAVKG